ncbi:NADPH-dependent FMN reductase [gamma proteobacterium IMCC1989]|nr:NADPH-dependent FMN reductase [gamma proteobacterium IMCC1989]
MSKVIALFSSARRNGNTGALIDTVAKLSKMTIINLDELNIAPFDYEYKNKEDDFLPLIEKVLMHQYIIFASPVYWYAVTPKMKAFIDRISDLLLLPELLDTGRQLRGKTAYIVSTSESKALSPIFSETFETTFTYLGIKYGGALHIDCSTGFDPQKNQQKIISFSNHLANPLT